MKSAISPWIRGTGTAVIAGVVLYLILPASAGIQNGGDVKGSIQTVGQTGGVNIIKSDEEAAQKIDYYDVSRLNALGVDAETDGSLLISSSISKLVSKFLGRRISNGEMELNFQCTREAIESYKLAMKNYPKWPFSYFYLGACEKDQYSLSWRGHVAEALRIFGITTAIEGHYGDHDFVLSLIEKDYLPELR